MLLKRLCCLQTTFYCWKSSRLSSMNPVEIDTTDWWEDSVSARSMTVTPSHIQNGCQSRQFLQYSLCSTVQTYSFAAIDSSISPQNVQLPSTQLEAAADLHLTTKFASPNLRLLDLTSTSEFSIRSF